MSMNKLDWHTGNVLWQMQAVDIHYDFDPDFAATPMVARTRCGQLSIGVQKDGYVHAVHVGHGGFHSNPACSYAGHNLECPRWSFPPVASLPFQTDGHGDTRFIRPGAMEGDRVYLAAGGYNLKEIAPTTTTGDWPPGRIVLNRIYSLDACAPDDDRIRWIFDLTGAQATGAPSVANGLIYVGADTEFDTSATPHQFYVLADKDTLPPSGQVCSYPLGPAGSGLPVGPACTGAGFKPVPVPQIVVQFPLTGAMPGHPAIAEGRVFVATTAGYLYGLAP
jgi:outer membrane protein assembly factor BamB